MTAKPAKLIYPPRPRRAPRTAVPVTRKQYEVMRAQNQKEYDARRLEERQFKLVEEPMRSLFEEFEQDEALKFREVEQLHRYMKGHLRVKLGGRRVMERFGNSEGEVKIVLRQAALVRHKGPPAYYGGTVKQKHSSWFVEKVSEYAVKGIILVLDGELKLMWPEFALGASLEMRDRLNLTFARDAAEAKLQQEQREWGQVLAGKPWEGI